MRLGGRWDLLGRGLSTEGVRDPLKTPTGAETETNRKKAVN